MDSVLDMQAVENFLKLARGAQNKDDYLSRVREFDQKFIDAYPSPVMNPLPNIPRSNSQGGSTFKQPQQPPKNPFVNSAQQKYRLFKQNTVQTVQSQFGYQIPQTQLPPAGKNKIVPPPNIPHSRSETNFYRQQQQLYEDFNFSPSYANQFYNNEQAYRQNMANRSYSYQPQPKGRTNPGPQPYIQNNQFIPSYQIDQPQYVKYYKKVIPQQNPKANYSQTPRNNPFK